MIFNAGGEVYKQTMVQTQNKSPEEPKVVKDEQVVAEDKKEPVKAPKKSRAKQKKEDK